MQNYVFPGDQRAALPTNDFKEANWQLRGNGDDLHDSVLPSTSSIRMVRCCARKYVARLAACGHSLGRPRVASPAVDRYGQGRFLLVLSSVTSVTAFVRHMLKSITCSSKKKKEKRKKERKDAVMDAGREC